MSDSIRCHTSISINILSSGGYITLLVDQLKHLESLVDLVLVTVVIIQAATSQPVILSPHTQRDIELLNTLVAPTSATTCPALAQPKPWEPTMPSYAQATKGSCSTYAPVEKNVKPSPAGHQLSRNRTRPRSCYDLVILSSYSLFFTSTQPARFLPHFSLSSHIAPSMHS